MRVFHVILLRRLVSQNTVFTFITIQQNLVDGFVSQKKEECAVLTWGHTGQRFNVIHIYYSNIRQLLGDS